ncbi:MAG: translation initiation factor eIF-2B [Candidatus Njordarchaeia archaeon]
MYLHDMILEIKNDKVSGAKELMGKALKYLREGTKLARNYEDYLNFVKDLKKAKPSMATLTNLSKIVERILVKKKSIEISHELDLIENYLKESSSKLIENAVSIIFKKKLSIMTISRSSTVLATLIQAKRRDLIKEVYVLESKPLGEGVRTVTELSKERIKVVFIPDLSLGYYMGSVDAVIVGADAILKNEFINKVGTYPLAVMAKEQKVPFFVMADTFKIDLEAESYPLEFGKEEDFCGEACPNVYIRVPIFEPTPNHYVSLFVTENGAYKQDEIGAAINKRNKILKI